MRRDAAKPAVRDDQLDAGAAVWTRRLAVVTGGLEPAGPVILADSLWVSGAGRHHYCWALLLGC